LTYKETIRRLHSLKDKEKVIFKAKKFGIISNNSLGIYHKDLKVIAKEIGRNNELATHLFDSGIYEARILCSKVCKPKDVNEKLMEHWVKIFNTWEICDSFCMGLFSKSKFAHEKILEWSLREPECQKRVAFANLASYCMADKTSSNKQFNHYFDIIKREANDDRIYVKKGVNWTLYSIGKRNIDIRQYVNGAFVHLGVERRFIEEE